MLAGMTEKTVYYQSGKHFFACEEALKKYRFHVK